MAWCGGGEGVGMALGLSRIQLRALHTRPKPPAPSFSTMAKSLWKREWPRSPALVRARVRVGVGVWALVRIRVRGSSQGKGRRA